MDKKYLENFIIKNQKEIIDDLSGLIEIESVSSNNEKVKKALLYVLEIGKKLGFETKSVLDDAVGIIEFSLGEETLGILTHVDVVDAGDENLWKTPPFKAVIKDGAMYGRGTIDDKGAIIASLYAMKAVKDSKCDLHKKIQLIIGTQEEVEWTDMEQYVKNFPLPDYGFTPDGEFPLCNIEKGAINIELSFPIDEIEHEGDYIVAVEAGKALNVVPGKCSTIIQKADGEQITITSTGKAVHSCQPEKGENAIVLMSKKLNEMNLENNKWLEVMRMINDKMTDLFGKEIGIYSNTEYYNGEYVHRNVFAPVIIKQLGGEIKLSINVRYPYGESSQRIYKAFEKIANNYGGIAVLLDDMPAVYISKDELFMKAFVESYDYICDEKSSMVLAYGGSYAKAIPNIASWGPIFPGEEDTCHEENEYIKIESLIKNIEIFAVAIHKIATDKKSFLKK